jgi:hypothetical protein
MAWEHEDRVLTRLVDQHVCVCVYFDLRRSN